MVYSIITDLPTVTGRRKVMGEYVFRDGLKVHHGDWICIPQGAMMHDRSRYGNAQAFDGFRFARANMQLRQGLASSRVPDKVPSTLTDTSIEWPIWGFGNTAW